MIFLWMVVGILIFLVCLSALCSGLETAVTALSPSRIRRMSDQGHVSAQRLHRLLRHKETMVGSLLLLNTASNIGASAVATLLFFKLWGEAGVFWATVVMTLVIFLFAEVTPKTLALSMAERFAMLFSLILQGWTSLYALVSTPIMMLLQKMKTNILGEKKQKLGSFTILDEIRGTIKNLRIAGQQYEGTLDMIEGVLDLEDVTVEGVMIYRNNMISLNKAHPQSWQKSAVKTRYRRLPVWQKSEDNIVGVLDVWGFLDELASGKKAQDIYEKHLTEPLFVPETTTLKQQMEDFLHRKVHQAIVIDEYGVLQGLVCLEDILEEIVGPINEERRERGQNSHEGMKEMADGSWQVEGWVKVRDYNRTTESQLPEEQAATMAGLVLNAVKRVPKSSEHVAKYGYQFFILKSNKRGIDMLSVSKKIPHQQEELGKELIA